MKTLGLDLKAGSLMRSGDEVFVGVTDRATPEKPRARATMPRRDVCEPILLKDFRSSDRKKMDLVPAHLNSRALEAARLYVHASRAMRTRQTITRS